LLLFAGLVICLSACSKKDSRNVEEASAEEPPPTSQRAQPVHDATFVGSKSCAECHADESKEWHGSDHHLAMQKADEESVLGNFDDVTFSHFGVESKFRKEDGKFFVKTPNSEGVPTDYPIEYTFGHYPLQQYLIAFPGGRYQALSVCWDSRPKAEGGQRWFHLYPEEKVPHDDILHWTRQHFNWNYMCADCHSTDLKKNYDLASNSYNTTWAEINVSCEACHGPGSEHLAWAKDPEAYKGSRPKSSGLTVVLKEPQDGGWTIDPITLKPSRTKPLESNVQIETCARCHARRRPLEDDFHHGQKFLDTHNLSVLEDMLYHPDGQINEEVYVHGSFVQSKMFHKGVRCTDCHNPHTLKLRAPGNALCAQCHVPAKYDSPTHHHHELGSTGASCVDCHMPEKHYMVVDPRRDHSIRIPRPDLSVKLGTPNACNQCHQDQDPKWAAEALAKWLKEDGKPVLPEHYGESIAAGRAGIPGAETKLIDLAANTDQPAIARATALGLLAQRPSQSGMQAIIAALADPDALVRTSALPPLEAIDPSQRIQFAVTLLSDPIRSVRIEAARVLAAGHVTLRAGPEAAAFDSALAEYEHSLDALADRPGSHMGYGLLHTALGDQAAAEKSYRDAFQVDPQHIESRINLAELIYQQGRVAEAGSLLQQCVQIAPQHGISHEALGRHQVRIKDYDAALVSLAEATRLMPDNAHIHYFYGVALNQLSKFEQALVPLTRAHQLAPQNPEYLIGLATICRDHSEWDLALSYAQKLLAIDPRYTEVYQSIEAQSRAQKK
jgi:predicted CXXCH cytochrome family protein